MPVRMQVQKLSRLKRKEEERSIIGHGSDVVGIVRGESVGVVTLNQRGECIGRALGRCVQKRQRRIISQVLPDRCFLFWSERSLFCQDRDVGPVLIELVLRDDDKVARYIHDPELMQRLHRNRGDPQSLAWLTELPPSD